MASQYYDWRHGRIHYRKSGLGDPILLVHGLYPGASSEEFDHNIRALSRDFRVYAIDLLGFGLSDAPRMPYRADLYAPLLGDFIRDVIGEPASVIASGASGPFLAILAAERPELISKVVFIAPQGAPLLPARAARLRGWACELSRMLLLLPPLNLMLRAVTAGEWEIGEMLRRSYHQKKRVNPTDVDRLCELAKMPGALRAYASLEAGLLSLPFEPALAHVPAPALFLCGTDVTPQAAAEIERLSHLPPRSRLEWIEQAAAWVHHEMANSTNRLLASFLSAEAPCQTAGTKEISAPIALAA